MLTRRIGDRLRIVGDDPYVTNVEFIRKGIGMRATNAVLLKLSPIGRVTEAIDAIELCRKAGWGSVTFHRSGETEDPFMADFAVAMGDGFVQWPPGAREYRRPAKLAWYETSATGVDGLRYPRYHCIRCIE